jgi:uncharacterized membrane protein
LQIQAPRGDFALKASSMPPTRALLMRAGSHWLLLANVVTALILVGAITAPLLASAGHMATAEAIHTLYLLLCPQRPAHSYFLFGHQIALEQRELAMFGGQLVAGLAYGVNRERWHWRPGWKLFVLVALPMAWDGTSQALGIRGSDWLTRTWTGALFNLAFVAWFYPYVEQLLGPRRPAVR